MYLSGEKIKNALKPEYKNIKILVFDSIDSTNNEAKRLISAGENSVFAVISESQTAGRGRQNRSFYSPGETGIYMTVVLKPDLPVGKAVKITVAAAVAVCETIEKLTDKKPEIKWVNDIFVGGKKVCGILTEAVPHSNGGNPSVVTGIGINVSTESFPDEIKSVAGSLNAKDVDRNILIADIINRLLSFSENLENERITDSYRSRSFVLGRKISFEQNAQSFTAEAIGIDENCGLIVKLADGTLKTLTSGEISIKLR